MGKQCNNARGNRTSLAVFEQAKQYLAIHRTTLEVCEQLFRTKTLGEWGC